MSQDGHESVARRQVLGLAGALAASVAWPAAAWPQAPGKPYRIDTHHHYIPPAYLSEMHDEILGHSSTDGGPILHWSAQQAIEDMDRNGVATAIASLPGPGVWFGKVDLGRHLARLANEYGAEMKRDHPGRFGIFAAIPLPDVEGSLKEIDYAIDTLKLNGIGLFTSYDGKYPGDPAFAPVFDEINRRKLPVFFHPIKPACCGSVVPEVTPAMIEYGTDSTRCITSLLINGTMTRCPDLRFLFSQGGGTFPFLAARIVQAISGGFNPAAAKITARLPHGPMYELRRHYYDCASVTNRPAMLALMNFVPVSQILLGTDFPFFSTGISVHGLEALHLFSAKELHAIQHDNARRIVPGLAA